MEELLYKTNRYNCVDLCHLSDIRDVLDPAAFIREHGLKWDCVARHWERFGDTPDLVVDFQQVVTLPRGQLDSHLPKRCWPGLPGILGGWEHLTLIWE